MITLSSLIIAFVIAQSLFLTAQSIASLFWMLYTWNNPEEAQKRKSPTSFLPPKFSFTALIPARNEERVISDTISAINNIDYPSQLKEAIVICRNDDPKTIIKVQQTLAGLDSPNFRLLVTNGETPTNKPHYLNQGLKETKGDVVAVFDAEDEPHKDIYNIVNSVMQEKKADVVQSGVQLMNYRSSWFSTLNVMEYFLWFKSGLHFFSKVGKVTPLAGNTVFAKRRWVSAVGGWDEECLTEDADLGFRLTLLGAKIEVVYDERHATQEETPPDIASFVKQRTRWNQGFLQILRKGDWKRLPSLRQKLMAAYILLSPEITTAFFLYTPIGTFIALTQKLPVALTLFSFLPLCLFILQLFVNIVGLYEFTRAYHLKFPAYLPLKVLLTIYPYSMILMFSAFRAFYRIAFNFNNWEKTVHVNAHRNIDQLQPSYV